jgi:hypothetical protein
LTWAVDFNFYTAEDLMKKVLVILISLLIAGCTSVASTMLIGGRMVKDDYKPSKILAAYNAVGNLPEGTQFYLIEQRGRPAMYGKDNSGMGMIYEKHWTENGNDYFAAAFYGHGPAYISFIPTDRSQEGGVFIYEHGTYQGTPGDRLRPMPYNPKSRPDVRLIPSK